MDTKCIWSSAFKKLLIRFHPDNNKEDILQKASAKIYSIRNQTEV